VEKNEAGKLHFQRGPDRRVLDVGFDPERRVQSSNRRHLSLRWLSLFINAEESAVIEAIRDCEVLLLQHGDVLLMPGEANDTVFLVLSGELGAYLDTNSATSATIPILPGECLGELSAIDGKPASALVKATTETRVLRLSQDVFWNRLMAVPGVARNLLVVLAARMRRNTEVMLEGQRRQIELEYLRQELDVARQLQVGMLPMRGLLFPDRRDIEIAGMMEAASSIGGDLFDAFFVDDRRLFFCIGDVSGHGIPAAMFMARAISLMRITAFSIAHPEVLLAHVNEQLCAGNDANMFVTLFCGFFEVDTGRIVYSNGGHLAPILWRDGLASHLPIPKGAAIGIINKARYEQTEIILKEGDSIFCFTDGVTEAQTADGEEFGESRLMSLVERTAHYPLDFVMNRVREEVAVFSSDDKLVDDCTMLAIRRSRAQT
jgi:sigma-B regulation protein RsbU (phosphoserine phosphatase)